MFPGPVSPRPVETGRCFHSLRRTPGTSLADTPFDPYRRLQKPEGKREKIPVSTTSPRLLAKEGALPSGLVLGDKFPGQEKKSLCKECADTRRAYPGQIFNNIHPQGSRYGIKIIDKKNRLDPSARSRQERTEAINSGSPDACASNGIKPGILSGYLPQKAQEIPLRINGKVFPEVLDDRCRRIVYHHHCFQNIHVLRSQYPAGRYNAGRETRIPPPAIIAARALSRTRRSSEVRACSTSSATES